MYPPPPYWDPYWAYYDPNVYPSEAPTDAQPNQEENSETQFQNGTTEQSSTPTMSEEEYYAQMPYWDPYYAYYAGYYGYYPPPPPHPYSPHAFYPSNETDDYSSTDEMNYYGARFPRGPTPCGHKSAPLNGDQTTPTDTEVEEINDTDSESVNGAKQSALQAIRSVSDIQIYNDTTGDEQSVTTEDEDDETDSSESEEEDSASTEDGEVQEGHLPHQLSVIFEESDISESHRSKREASIATTISEDDSSTTIEGGHEESDDSCDEDLGESTVTFRLPLKLKFGMSENGMEEVTELIVGDSEMKPSTPETISELTKSNLSYSDNTMTEQYARSPLNRQHSNETIDNYETAEESEESRDNSPVKSFEANEDEDTDFWNEIQKNVKSDDENDNIVHLHKAQEIDESGDADVSDEEIITQVEATIPKQSSEEKESSGNNMVNGHNEEDNGNEEDDEEEESSDSDDDDDNSDNEDAECKLEKYLRDAFASDAVKKRVRALREAGKLCIGAENKEEAVSVRQRVMAIENGTTNASRSSSMKGCDLSEEDGDSGVTSDVSRHTDTESESVPERLKRRYERAATHSRLFKLLQEACANSDDEDEDDDDEQDSEDKNNRRKQLTLPLNTSEPESFASSGICSPASPTWLARELVNELLGCRSGRRYKSLPLEKLYAAAHRILQEDARSNTSEDGSPSEPYANEYKNYYSSWEEAGSRCSSSMKKRIARCPRVKSEKNVHAKMSAGAAEETQSPTNRSQSRCRSRSRSKSPCRSRQLATSAS